MWAARTHTASRVAVSPVVQVPADVLAKRPRGEEEGEEEGEEHEGERSKR